MRISHATANPACACYSTGCYSYDKLARLLSDSVSTFGSRVNNTLNKLERAFNERGLIIRAASYNTSGGTKANEVAWDYNSFGQPTAEYQEHSGAVNKGSSLKVQYSYANGSANTIRPTGITSPNGTVITTAYDSAIANALSRADAVKESSTTLASFKYLGLSVPVNLKYDAAANAEWTMRNGGTGEDGGPYTGLDRFGRLVETLWKTSSATLVNTTYGRNRVGGATWKRDVLAHAGSVATEDHFYWYDSLQQNYRHERGDLTPGGGPPYTGIAPATRQQQEIRSFDETGNWLTDVASASSLNQSRTHNKANEITDLTGPGGVIDPAHSAVGNMTTLPKPGAWTTSCALTWDAWNRPVTFNDGAANSYKYDALHRRIAKTTASPAETRDFYFDDQWRAIEERVSGAVKAHYVWSPTDRWTLIRRKRSVSGTLDETLFLLKDYLDPVAIINTSAAVQERFSYDAFGPVRFLTPAFGARGSSSFGWNFLFHAEFRDEESGLYNYGFRYYHPYLGRWISRDPVASFEERHGDFAEDDGEEEAEFNYVYSDNLFDYCFNKPVNLYDSLGEAVPLVVWGGIKLGMAIGARIAARRAAQALAQRAAAAAASRAGASIAVSGAVAVAGAGGIDAIRDTRLRTRCRRLRKDKDNACNGAGGCNSHMCCKELARRLSKADDCNRLRNQITQECFGGVTDPGHQMREAQARQAREECRRIMSIKCANQPGVF